MPHDTTRQTAGVAAMALLIFLLALAPRALATGEFVTVDEGVHWFTRARTFLAGIQSGDYAQTIVAGHPGVTTAWLGAIGELIYQQVGADDPALRQRLLRLPVAVVTALCVALAFLLLRRLLGGRVALLAALLLASDPFLIAHSQLLHLDALLTSFMLVSLLAAMLAFRLDRPALGGPPRWWALGASGLAGGLALLTKSPSVMLAPMMGLIALLGTMRGRRTGGGPAALLASLPPARALLTPLLAWGAVALAVWFALWPATWVDPAAAVGRVVDEARTNGGTPHGSGNFFLGRSVADPGPLFYPVAIALRLTPWAIVGLLAAPAALAGWREQTGRRRVLALLALFAVLMVAALSVLAKKFDRYALPVFPALDIIAAAGLVRMAGYAAGLGRWLGRRTAAPLLRPAAWALAAGALALHVAWYHPYELAYYNPALGGGRLAQRVVPVGWGEGYELAGAYIMEQPDACERPIAVWYRVLVERFVCANTIPMREFGAGQETGYVILYIDQIQRGYYPDALARLARLPAPLHTVRVHGIDYAHIYQMPPPPLRPVDARFGGAIRLQGYDIEVDRGADPARITLDLQWQALRRVSEDFSMFAHVIAPNGERVAQVDVPAGDPRQPTSDWEPNQYVTQHQTIPLPRNLPAGPYWIEVGVYESDSLKRLPLSIGGDASVQSSRQAGPNSVRLGPFVLAK